MFKQFVLLLSLVALSLCIPDGCKGPVNNAPLLTAELQPLETVPNGKKFLMQNGTTFVYVGVFEGSPYEVGKAYGQLFKKEMEENFDQMMDWMINYVKTVVELPKYLKWVQKLPSSVIKAAINLYLDITHLTTWAFTNKDWQDEFKGMADGSGISSTRIQNFNLIPEALRASCSIYGLWGPATLDGRLLHLRGLDWDPSGPMSQFPVVSVYKFNTEGSQTFANFGWAGMVGSLAGFSPKIGIGERLWGDKGNVTMFGQPWMYVLRDVLQYGTNLETSVGILEKAHRTWAIYVGLSSLEDNQLEIIKYAEKELIIEAQSNYTSPCPDAHPQEEGMLYIDNLGQCDPCVGTSLMQEYGNITAEYLFRNPAAMAETGDTLLAVYDFEAMMVYLAYAKYPSATPAYEGSMLALNMTQLFGLSVNE